MRGGAILLDNPLFLKFNRTMIIQRLFSLRNNAPDTIKLDNEITLEKSGFGVIAKVLRNFKSIRRRQDKQLTYNIKLNGKEIGYLQIHETISNSEINIMWLNINKGYEGNHYATKAMKSILEWAKKNGFRKVTLEVPGSSPNARHIYDKLGFKVVKEEESEFWDGLTYMEKIFSLGKNLLGYGTGYAIGGAVGDIIGGKIGSKFKRKLNEKDIKQQKDLIKSRDSYITSLKTHNLDPKNIKKFENDDEVVYILGKYGVKDNQPDDYDFGMLNKNKQKIIKEIKDLRNHNEEVLKNPEKYPGNHEKLGRGIGSGIGIAGGLLTAHKLLKRK